MERLYSRFRDRVEFFVVYIQEAHPTDGWQVESNISEEILYRQHQSFDEREEAAQSCTIGLHISIPTLVEEMDNAIDEAYGAAPERLYLIGQDGKVVYHGGAGPHFFDLEELDEAIQMMVAGVEVS
ncbi:MAG: hypothetical protein IH872_12255 [Chloroflexi bacterium]|nr:hypothetical protein [Chloroflexota bacterium]